MFKWLKDPAVKWGVISFVGALALSLPLIAYCVPWPPLVSEPTPNRPPMAYDPEAHPDQYEDKLLKSRDAAFWWTRAGNTETYQAICSHPIDRENADLCQQWRSANAAYDMSRVAWPQFAVSTAGLFGLIASLFFTARAASAASHAVEVTQEQAGIARDSLAHAKETAEREFVASHPPKIVFRVVRVKPNVSARHVEAAIRLANIGGTAARVRAIRSSLFIAERVPAVLPLEDETGPFPTIPAGSSTKWNIHATLTGEALFRLHQDQRFYCAGVVDYVDENGQNRQGGFCRVYNVHTARFDATNDPDHEYAY